LAHRRPLAAARRDYRGPGTGHRAGTGARDPAAQGARLYADSGGAEFQIRTESGGSPLCDRAWQGGRAGRAIGSGVAPRRAESITRCVNVVAIALSFIDN